MFLYRTRTAGLALLCLFVFSGVGVGQFETRGSFGVTNRPTSVAVGDFNHDGKLDIAVVAGSSNTDTVSILLGKGDGTFQLPIYYTVGYAPISVVAADFNHDGNLDLAVASQSSYLGIMLGNSDGTFQAATQSPPVPVFEQFVTVGDFNGDGKPDLVALSIDNPCKCISVLMGNGDGTFQSAVITEPTFSVTAIGAGDFNKDGNLDLATAGSFGSGDSVNILLGNGDGTFNLGATYTGGTEPGSITIADLNGDHKLDFAVANYGDESVGVFLGNGDGTFNPSSYYPASTPNFVIAADVNGDHKPDLVVANALLSAGVLVFLGKGDGTFESSQFYPAGTLVEYATVGDFNGDGKKDIIVADSHASDVIVLLNTGNVTLSPTSPLKFKNQAVGTTSAPLKVKLTNSGQLALKIAAMKSSTQFGMTSTCHASVAVGTTCTISVTFSPISTGAKSGTVTINDSASSKPMVIELSGTGT